MIPEVQEYKKFYIQLSGSQMSFEDVDPVHAEVGCVNCHGGQEPGLYETAHDTSFGFRRDPSEIPEETCNPCHSDIVSRNTHSIHSNQWGYQNRIAERIGEANFESCPESVQSGWEVSCYSCHTTCGQCHVSRPNSKGGGLIENGPYRNHKFAKSELENCIACHETRAGIDLTGLITGRADVHYGRQKCWDCHTEDMHGDGTEEANPPQSRYHVAGLPTCDGCHSDASTSNTYHSMHWPVGGAISELACYVCHSQPYKNCGNCHVGGEGTTSENTFKIGYNWQPELHKGKWVVVRHIPTDDSTFVNWGELINMNDENQRPNWEYTSPHNIRKFTVQTDTTGGVSCSQNCHLSSSIPDSIRLLNTNRFLLRSDLHADESGANDKATVDDHLPTSWDPLDP